MSNWDFIKANIKRETNDYFSGKNLQIDECLQIFHDIVTFSIDKKHNLDGIPVTFTKSLSIVLDDETKKTDLVLNFEIICKAEQILRKILVLVDDRKYAEIVDNNRGFAAVLKTLCLNPNNIDYKDESRQITRTNLEYDYHLYNVYKLRNIQSHEMKEWSYKQLAENQESLLIFYLHAIDKHKVKLLEVLSVHERQNYIAYLENIVQEFEDKSKRFVHIESKEDYSVFEGVIVEQFSNEIDDEKVERFGTIDNIRKTNLKENRMLIWAEAGMGKSTTLQYLTYLDAKDYLDGKSTVIPVYVPLGLLINKSESILDYIFKKLELDYITGCELTRKGSFNIFLDGVNEVSVDENFYLQNLRKKEIQQLIDDFKNTLFIISNRPEDFNTFKRVPVFRLQRMKKEKVIDFVEKNVENNISKELIIDEIEINDRLLQIIGTPLMTTRLIEIVNELNEIPNSEGEIIGKFLTSLFKREVNEKKESGFDIRKVDILLSELSNYSISKYGTNFGLNFQEVINVFSLSMETNHFNIDSFYVLKKIVELGILDFSEELYVFSHQAYQDYYYAQYIKSYKKNNPLLSTKSVDQVLLKDSSKSRYATFYRQKSKLSQYEMSIMYLIHSCPIEQRSEEIKELCKNNILLAAKTLASSERDYVMEEYITSEAIKYINSYSDDLLVNNDSVTQGILALIEIERFKELSMYYSVLNYGKKCKEIISSIIYNINNDKCIEFIESVIKTDCNHILRHAVTALYYKKPEFIWGADNYNVIKEIYNKIYLINRIKSVNLIRFYLGFNVPKELIKNHAISDMKRLLPKNVSIVVELEQKYNFGLKICEISLCEECIKHNKYSYVKTAIELLENKHEDIIRKILNEAVYNQKTYYLGYLFNQLSIDKQTSFALEFPQNGDFKSKIKNCKKLPQIISSDAAYEIILSNSERISY